MKLVKTFSMMSALILVLTACSGTAPTEDMATPTEAVTESTPTEVMETEETEETEEAKAEPKEAEKEEDGSAETASFPVEIEHALGTTVVEEKPERVVAIGWGNDEYALALDVVPVGMTMTTWGGNENKSTDWRDEKLEELGAMWGSDAAPKPIDDSDGVPFEDIALLEPDVILAMASGLTQEDYDRLTEIAPVVPYKEQPWRTDWETSLEMAGMALGEQEKAEQVKEETLKVIEDAKKNHPKLQGKTFFHGYLRSGEKTAMGFYGPLDTRPRLMESVGMVIPDLVQEEAAKTDDFHIDWPAERASELESDLFLGWKDEGADADEILDDPLIQQIPAVKAGNVVLDEPQMHLIASTSSPLALQWGLEKYLDNIEKNTNLK